MEAVEETKGRGGGVGRLALYGGLMLVGYVALTLLLFSPSMGYPALIPQSLPALFEPLRGLFPPEWLAADRSSPLALLNSVLFLLIVAGLFWAYLGAVRWVWRLGPLGDAESSRALRLLIVYAGAALLVTLFAWNMLSTDLYNYIWVGRILAIYGENPYAHAPIEYAALDTTGWLQWGIWHDLITAYGPFWTALISVIAAVAEWVGGGEIVPHLLGHRLLADGLHLLNIWLIWRVAPLALRHMRPDAAAEEVGRARLAATLLYAWNPLLLIEFGVSGHNDALVLTLVLAALWLHLKGLWRLAAFAVVLTGLVKLPALIFLPAYLFLHLWEGRRASRGRWEGGIRRVAEVGLITVVAWVAMHAPIWEGGAPLAAFNASPASYSYNHSLGKMMVAKANEGVSLVARELQLEPAHEWSSGVLRAKFDPYVRWSLRGLTVLLFALAVWRARDFRGLLVAWSWGIFAYLTVGAIWFWPWYISALIVPLALLGPSRLLTATHIFSFSSLTIYAFFPRLVPPYDELATWTGLITMAPPLLYLAWAYRGSGIGVRRRRFTAEAQSAQR